MAGMAGLEPASEGVKVPCLTTWLHPCIASDEMRGRAEAEAPALPPFCVGWVKGLEPSTPGTTIRCSNQLSYTHHILLRKRSRRNTATKRMARLKGLEPLTHCLEGSCSIHLSYRRVWSG